MDKKRKSPQKTDVNTSKKQSKISETYEIIPGLLTATITESEEKEQAEKEVEKEEPRPVGRPKKEEPIERIHFRVSKDRKEEWKSKAKEVKKSLTAYIIDKVEAVSPASGVLHMVSDMLELIRLGPYHGREVKQALKQMEEYIATFISAMHQEREILENLVCAACATPRNPREKICSKCGCKSFQIRDVD